MGWSEAVFWRAGGPSSILYRMIGKLQRVLLSPVFYALTGAVLLSIASLTGAPMGNDEGVWAYLGRIWADHGLLPYSGAIENKATGIYMVYALSHKLFGFNIWWPRLLALAAIVGTAGLIYAITKRLSDSRAALFALAIFLLIMPLASLDSAYAETESFMNFFRVLAILLTLIAYAKEKNKSLWLMLSGISVAFAISFKQLAILDAVPLLFFHIVLAKREIKQIIINLLYVFFGLLAGTFVSLIPYLLSGGTIANYIDGAWLILLQSGSSPHSLVSRASGFFRHFFNVRLSFLTMAMVAFIALRKKIQGITVFTLPLLVWAITDFIAYNADGWYLDHHYKVFVSSWSIVFGIVISYSIYHIAGNLKHEAYNRIAAYTLLALIIFYIPFEPNYFHSIRKAIKGGGEFDRSGENLGLYIRAHTRPNDHIYIWGWHIGAGYYYSDRVASSRYFSEPFLGRPGAMAELQSDLERKPPALIAIPLQTYFMSSIPPWFVSYVAREYKQTDDQFGFHIYARL